MRTRRRQINLYLSDHEHQILTEKCRAGRLSQAAFLRHCIVDKPINVPPDRDYHTLYREINAIGNNINQISFKFWRGNKRTATSNATDEYLRNTPDNIDPRGITRI